MGVPHRLVAGTNMKGRQVETRAIRLYVADSHPICVAGIRTVIARGNDGYLAVWTDTRSALRSPFLGTGGPYEGPGLGTMTDLYARFYWFSVVDFLELSDLAEFAAEETAPLHVRYRGHDVYGIGLPTQSPVMLETLKILEGFDLQAMGHNSADYVHHVVEALKLAFADRDAYLADCDFMPVSAKDLIDSRRVEKIRNLIRMDSANDAVPSVSPPDRGRTKEGAPHGDTEYVAAADREGNLVSFIQSNFMGFGSGVVEPETAIILQNRGHLFSLDENHPNCIAPHKRCVHTLMPGLMLKDGKPYAALGLKGGHVQPQVQAQIISNHVDFGMTPQEAIAAARFNHIDGLKVGLEPEIATDVKDELKRRGHQVAGGNPESFGGAHMILIDPDSGALVGGSDPRKGGCALGF